MEIYNLKSKANTIKVILRSSFFAIVMMFLLLQTLFGCQYYGKRHWNAVLPYAKTDFRIIAYQNTERKTEYPLLELGIVIFDSLNCDKISITSFTGKAKFLFTNNEMMEVPLKIEEHQLYSPVDLAKISEKSSIYFFGVWGGSHDFSKSTYGYCAARLGYPKHSKIIQKPIKEIFYDISLSIVLPSTEKIEVTSGGKMDLGKWCGKCKDW